MIKPWETEEGNKIWKTKAAFFNYIRGGLRKGLWMRHPLKLELLKQSRVRVPLGKKTKSNPEGMVWGCICESCGGSFKQSEVQVDHLQGNNKLTSVEDLQKYIENMVFIDKSMLQIVCKLCHTIKTYSEREGISFEEAKATKEAIAIQKNKVLESSWFIENGVEAGKNAKVRRQQIIDKLIGD